MFCRSPQDKKARRGSIEANSHCFLTVGYTGVFNVLDYSAVSFPTGMTADKQVDVDDSTYQPLSDDCMAIHESCKLNPGFTHPFSAGLTNKSSLR